MTDKRRGLESLLEESRIVDESSRALMATYPKESRSSYDARHMAQSLAREQAMRDAELRDAMNEAVERERRASIRRAAEQMMDAEYVTDVENLSGLPMTTNMGGVLSALGYHGSPYSAESQAEISHFADPMGYGNYQVLGSYIPRGYGFHKKSGELSGYMPSREEQRSLIAERFENFNFLTGEPPPVRGVALDVTGQDDMRSYGDTFRHELRHRGVDSAAFERFRKRLGTSYGPGGDWGLWAKTNRVKREQEAIYETIRQLQQGELTYEDLSEEDRERLDAFKDVEQALLDSLSRSKMLKLGLFERKAPADPPDSKDPVEMPEDYRAGGRVRLI